MHRRVRILVDVDFWKRRLGTRVVFCASKGANPRRGRHWESAMLHQIGVLRTEGCESSLTSTFGKCVWAPERCSAYRRVRSLVDVECWKMRLRPRLVFCASKGTSPRRGRRLETTFGHQSSVLRLCTASGCHAFRPKRLIFSVDRKCSPRGVATIAWSN